MDSKLLLFITEEPKVKEVKYVNILISNVDAVQYGKTVKNKSFKTFVPSKNIIASRYLYNYNKVGGYIGKILQPFQFSTPKATTSILFSDRQTYDLISHFHLYVLKLLNTPYNSSENLLLHHLILIW